MAECGIPTFWVYNYEDNIFRRCDLLFQLAGKIENPGKHFLSNCGGGG
jgi:hypothetical protein